MAISLETWLKRAGRKRSWYDALPAAQKAEVQASVKNTPKSLQLQEIGLNEPNTIAARLDNDRKSSAEPTLQRNRIEQGDATARKDFSSFLKRMKRDYSWYESLPSGLRDQVINEFNNSREGGKALSTPATQQMGAINRIDAESKKPTAAPTPSATPTAPVEAGPNLNITPPPVSKAEVEAKKSQDIAASPEGKLTMLSGQEASIKSAFGLPYTGTGGNQLLKDQYGRQQVTPFAFWLTDVSEKPTLVSGRQEFTGGEKISQASAADRISVDRFANIMSGWSAGKLAKFQDRLIASGYLNEGQYARGDKFDPATREAAATALTGLAVAESQGIKISLYDFLDERAKGYARTQKLAEGEAARERARLRREALEESKPVFRPVDQGTVDAEADQFAQAVIGRKFSGVEKARFSSEYRKLERRNYQMDVRAHFGKTAERITPEGMTETIEENVIEEDDDLAQERFGNQLGAVSAAMAAALKG